MPMAEGLTAAYQHSPQKCIHNAFFEALVVKQLIAQSKWNFSSSLYRVVVKFDAVAYESVAIKPLWYLSGEWNYARENRKRKSTSTFWT